MIDIENSFIYPDNYQALNHRFHSDELYELFAKKILFRIEATQNGLYGISFPNGVLIYGPPCNGKSFLAKQFAQSTKLPYIIINRYELLEDGSNHVNRNFSKLMSIARNFAPCVIILENVETIIPNRKKIINTSDYVDIMSILSLIRGCGERGVLVFSTTSKPTDVDPQLGMCGYLNEIFYAPFPDIEQRLKIIKQLIIPKLCKEAIDYGYIARECENFTIGDLVTLSEEIIVNSAFTNTLIGNDTVLSTLDGFNHLFASSEKKRYDEFHSLLKVNKRSHNRVIGFT